MDLRERRKRISTAAAESLADPYRYFPDWYRKTRPNDLLSRPIFLPVGWTEAIAAGRRGELELRGVGESISQYLLNGAVWRLAPTMRRLSWFAGDDGPTLLGRVERGLLAASSMARGPRQPRPLRSLDHWVEQARLTPQSLSIIPESGDAARTCGRLATAYGIEALLVTEALRTPEFRYLARGPSNDLLGDLPTRIDEFFALESSFADAESIDVLHGLLYYRLTHERRALDAIATHPSRKYFPVELFDLHEHERLFDIGAFTGDTLQHFLNLTADRFVQAVCLEPDDHNFYFLRKNVAALPASERSRIACLNLGAWHSPGELRFHALADVGSSVEADGVREDAVSTIQVTSVDTLAEEHGAPTIIKCEAEGADRDVVRGAVRTISSHRPRLAITTYHLPDDLLVLVPMIRAANPDYRLALRHYTTDHTGTTIYAY